MDVKIRRVTILVVICWSFCAAQTVESEPETVVRAMLDSKMPGVWIEGNVDKQLSRMGDRGCVALTKVIAGRKLSSVEMERALVVVHLSFGAPKIVSEKADREPKTALFVLNWLEMAATDPELVTRIRETRAYVQEQYRKATQDQNTVR
ncbi:MAG TPA: hypothetical protein VLE48_02755 [Terriglobales bacterium]|nr:hypothetical protein [Terriglobales bacterium]